MRAWLRGAPLAIGAAGVLVALAGCGGDDVPEGFTRFEEDGVSISYPESWRELPARGTEQNVVLRAREQGRPAVEAAQVTVTRVDEETTFSSLLTDIKIFNRNRLNDSSFVDEREAEVDGADEAQLLVTDYVLRTDDGDIPYRARQVLALKEPDLQLNVAVTAPRDAYDRFDADAILDSLSID
jgi:hypothetical protein